MGPARLRGRLFDAVVAAFAEDRATGIEVLLACTLTRGRRHSTWLLEVCDNVCSIWEASGSDMETPQLWVRLRYCDLLRLIGGELSGPLALVTGRIRFDGDLGAGWRLRGCFETG